MAIKLQAIQRRQPQDVLDAKLLLLQRRLKKRLEGKLLQRKRKKMQRCRCRCQIELSAFFLPHTIVQPIPYDRPAHFLRSSSPSLTIVTSIPNDRPDRPIR